MSASFKPGDRVEAFGVVMSVDGDGWLTVKFDGEETETQMREDALRFPPTSISHLRAAAEVCVEFPAALLHPNEANQCGQIVIGLRKLAAKLEASTTPKPPTLREAAEAVVRSGESGGRDMDARILALEEALAREPSP